MADYIYTMEIRLTPDQQRGVTLVQDIARAAGMNIYLTGGAVRDIISGFPIRDLDFSVQGNPLKLQKDLERAGVRIAGTEDDLKTLYLGLPGNVRAEISMARIERYEKAGKPPLISPATLIESGFTRAADGPVQRGGRYRSQGVARPSQLCICRRPIASHPGQPFCHALSLAA
jgi:hypothetical protein